MMACADRRRLAGPRCRGWIAALAATTLGLLAATAAGAQPASGGSGPQGKGPEVLGDCDLLTAPSQNADNGVRVDWNHAVEVCTKALEVEPNEPHFHFALGKAYFFSKNYIEAVRHLRVASDAGAPDAQAALGFCYTKGLGVIKNERTGLDLYMKAAAAGSPTGMELLGITYVEGSAVKRDYTKALDWLEKSIEAGNAGALKEVGRMYFNGLGVPRDFVTAANYYQQAADLGDGNAMRVLANIYEVGFLGKPDLEKAGALRLRAQQVDPDGQQADPIEVVRRIYNATHAAQGGGGGVRRVVQNRRYVYFRRRIFLGCIWRWC
jgi:tetratricopeptide (TPR) repeat protein